MWPPQRVISDTQTAPFQNSKPIKDKNGNTLTNEKDQAARWTEHFKEVLNQPSHAKLPTIEEDDPEHGSEQR